MSEQKRSGDVVLTVWGPHARVELNRPSRRNAVDLALVRELSRIFAELHQRTDVRVVSISGRGPSFCAGADIGEFAELAAMSAVDCEAVFAENMAMLEMLSSLPQVTVAMVHGMTAGLGISLVSRCDLALGGRSAKFGLPELSLGVVPALVLVDVRRVMPVKVANDWLLLGGRRGAEEALLAGLLSRVVEDESLLDERDRLIATLLAVPAGALSRTIELAGLVDGGDKALARSLAISDSAAGIASQDAQDSVARFLSSRSSGKPELGAP